MALESIERNDLTSPVAMMELLGTFWSGQYAGGALVADYVAARNSLELQSADDFSAAVDCTARADVPVYKKHRWMKLSATRADMSSPGVEGPFSFTLPEDVVSVAVVADVPNRWAVALSSGMDFDMEDGELRFLDDPFESGLFLVELAESADDDTISLYLGGVEEDTEIPYEQYGHVAGLYMANSEQYKKLVNVILDAAVTGTRRSDIEKLFSVLCDVPIAEHDETIEEIVDDRRWSWVLTDKSAYKFKLDSPLLVSEGDVLSPGDVMAGSVCVFDLTGGTIPAGMGPIILAAGYLPGLPSSGPLEFSDMDVATQVTLNVSGKTKIQWDLVGDSADITAFWNLCHTKGVAAGTTLANLMDLRASPSGEPTAASLPASVNPLQFLVENVMRFNLIVVKVNTAFVGDNAFSLDGMEYLYRKIVPPEKALIVQEVSEGDGLYSYDFSEDFNSFYVPTM